MARFNRGGKKELPAISTASLPDVVFMLLFFFMVATQLRQTSLKIWVKTPKATETIKMEKKSLVSYIYVGKPMTMYAKLYGTESVIQLNDMISEVDDVMEFIYNERQAMPEVDRGNLIVSIKADETTKMGIITDIKLALRRSSALRVNYSAKKIKSY